MQWAISKSLFSICFLYLFSPDQVQQGLISLPHIKNYLAEPHGSCRPHLWQTQCWMYSILQQDAWLLMCLHACRQLWQHLQNPNSTSVFLGSWWKVLEEKKDEVLDDFSAKNQNNKPLKLATRKPNCSIHVVHTRLSFISFQKSINGCKKSS